jgi:hypothetical protein
MQTSQHISNCHSMVVKMVLSNQTSYPLIRILRDCSLIAVVIADVLNTIDITTN